MSFYRQQLEEWLKTLDVNAAVVYDVGGKQLPVKGRTKSWHVENYKILDLPNYDVQHSPQYHMPKDKADIVFCLEVFEYLTHPFEALCNIRRLLKPTGKAYVTFAFAYPHHNELELDALRYTESGIRRLAKEAHLTVINIMYREDRSGFLERFYQFDGMHPAKEYSHHNATGFIVELMQ